LVENNIIDGIWGGIRVNNNGDNIIRNNNISCKSAGVIVNNANTITIEGNRIESSFQDSDEWYLEIATVNDVVISSNELLFGNDVIPSNSSGIYIDNSDAVIDHNLIVAFNAGIQLIEAGNVLSNNTIVGDGSGNYAIYVSNYSFNNPEIKNNIITDFQNGIYADHDLLNYNISYNDLWQISGDLFSGSAMPPIIGEIIDQNLNGDPADIYYNISMDPLYIDGENGDYNLQSDSPCINAGLPLFSDPDGTIIDMGAYYYDNPPEGDPPGSGPAFTVSGSAYLSGQNDHSGIQVIFFDLVLMAPEDSVYTAEDGSYGIDISPGL
jgi:hypothetical protein